MCSCIFKIRMRPSLVCFHFPSVFNSFAVLEPSKCSLAALTIASTSSWAMSPCWMRLIGLQDPLDFGPSLGFEIGPLKRGY